MYPYPPPFIAYQNPSTPFIEPSRGNTLYSSPARASTNTAPFMHHAAYAQPSQLNQYFTATAPAPNPFCPPDATSTPNSIALSAPGPWCPTNATQSAGTCGSVASSSSAALASMVAPQGPPHVCGERVECELLKRLDPLLLARLTHAVLAEKKLVRFSFYLVNSLLLLSCKYP